MSNTKVMIVEDEKIVAMDIKSSLENLGYTVTAIADSSETALKKVVETRPDLILMDIHIKGDVDGITTAEKIHTNFNIPVIYLTANADNKTLQRAKLTEPFGYILKPFEEKELNVSIEMAIYKHQKESQVRANGQWFATTLKSIGDAVIAVDNNNTVVFVNTIAETLTGWKHEDAIGKKLLDIFNVLEQETRKLIATSAIQNTQRGIVIDLPEDTSIVAKTGKLIPITGSAAAIRNSRGNITGSILSFRTNDKSKQIQEATPLKLDNSSKIDDITLIQTFVQNFIQGQVILLTNQNLRTEHVGDTIQLLGRKTEGLIVKAMLTEKPRNALVKKNSRYWELIHQAMFTNSFFPVGQTQESVYRYQHRPIPENYQMHCTAAQELWQVWVENKQDQAVGISMSTIVLRQGTWNPVVELIDSSEKTLWLKTISGKVAIDKAEMLIWGKKSNSEQLEHAL